MLWQQYDMYQFEENINHCDNFLFPRLLLWANFNDLNSMLTRPSKQCGFCIYLLLQFDWKAMAWCDSLFVSLRTDKLGWVSKPYVTHLLDGFSDSVWPQLYQPGTLQNNLWPLKYFDGREAFDPVCKGPALYNFGISDKLYFFSAKWDNFTG